jgi:hypothetical protein
MTVLRTLGIAFGAIGALALAEASIGVVAPSFDPRQQLRFVDVEGTVPMAEPNKVMRQVKNTGDYDVLVHTNRHGFRDAKDIAAAEPDDYVLVGDSYAFGWGVEEKDRLSDLLQSRLGARVFNIAMTGNLDTYQRLLDYATRLGARIRNVVVCVTMESDLQIYTPAPDASRAPPPPAQAVPTAHVVLEAKQWLLTHFGLYFLTTALVHKLPWLEALAVRAGVVVPNLEGTRNRDFDPVIVESTAQRVAAFARNYKTTVVLIPSRSLWHGDAHAAERRTHDALVARLAALGVATVDLRPAFERGGKPLQQYFRGDPHLNKDGNLLAADTVAGQIRRER